MEEEIKKQFSQQQELLERIYQSAEKTRKYFLWTIIISVALFVIPLIIVLFMLPSFIKTLTSGISNFPQLIGTEIF